MITQRHRDLSRMLADKAREIGLTYLRAEFNLGYTGYRKNVEMHWSRGTVPNARGIIGLTLDGEVEFFDA